jgi:transposase
MPLGLVPATEQSGDRDPQRRISKEGDEMLRRLLVGSAHYILGPFAKEDSRGTPQTHTTWTQTTMV